MASSGRTRKTRSSRRRKQQVMNKKQSPEQNKQKEKEVTSTTEIEVCDSVCSTPKGHRFRIPEISSCPPAPKKQRLLTNFSLRRSLSFCSPPDLDAFFRLALQDVSVPLVF